MKSRAPSCYRVTERIGLEGDFMSRAAAAGAEARDLASTSG
jgi:hypothetical protein